MAETDGEDVMVLGPTVGSDGSRAYLRHKANHEWETGVIGAAQEGKPVSELLQLTPREGDPGFYNVEEVYSSRKSGPAFVNSQAYRSNWDRIFPSKVGVA